MYFYSYYKVQNKSLSVYFFVNSNTLYKKGTGRVSFIWSMSLGRLKKAQWLVIKMAAYVGNRKRMWIGSNPKIVCTPINAKNK